MINYKIIQDSIEYYQNCGFQRIESPWTVTDTIANITKPEGASNFSITEKNKVLVASGEQSFLYLYNKGFLPKGRFQTVTPCFRDEKFDDYHTKYFIKNELIITDTVDKQSLKMIVNIARDFFREYCLRPKKDDAWVGSDTTPDDVYIMETGTSNKIVSEVDVSDVYLYPSYDLMYRGIELGSYGIRRCNYLSWIYGTGVALPRLTRVLSTFGVYDF